MKKNLKDIATIQTGLFAKPMAEGNIVYLQAKHFDENGMLLSTLYPDLMSEGISNKHLLRNDDVLFAAKGSKNFAAVFEAHNAPSVASTSFFVFRITDKMILPQFLVWYLNHPTAQEILKRTARGTSIPSIRKSVLEELEILIPNMETQKAILKITNLHNTEKKLKKEIELLREKQIQQLIINSIK